MLPPHSHRRLPRLPPAACSDFFLVPSNYGGVRSLLVSRFGELMRKMWNGRNFKGQVTRGVSGRQQPSPLSCAALCHVLCCLL